MKIIVNMLLAFSLIYGLGYGTGNQFPIISAAQAADCVANNNLSETAQSYIGRCRKGIINSEFPGEMYSLTLGAIKNGSTANHNKAWKLLNDSRFAK
jgi:hypothetical protein